MEVLCVGKGSSVWLGEPELSHTQLNPFHRYTPIGQGAHPGRQEKRGGARDLSVNLVLEHEHLHNV